jgi:hypothetical protein
MTSYGGNTYTYNAGGLRTGKTTANGTMKYYYAGNKLLAEKRGDEVIEYIYGIDGVVGFRLNGAAYHYRKNVQGDILIYLTKRVFSKRDTSTMRGEITRYTTTLMWMRTVI